MNKKYILAIDQGTTGSRAVLYDRSARFAGSAYQEFTQHYPHPGWVEHHPEEIWASTLKVIRRALNAARTEASQVEAIGITNQRETTVLWDRQSGKPVAPAIVWQDRRTSSLCAKLKADGFESVVRKKTGLVLDPYFSGTKVRWLLDSTPGLRRKAEKGQVLFGTIDSWLLWKLTGGKSHATDFTNASRTLVFDIKKKMWDSELLEILKIPQEMLPEALPSGSTFGETVSQGPIVSGIPITAMMGDQQAALYGQGCYEEGEAKNTYGTGCFILFNLGKHFKVAPRGLLTTLACDENGRAVYALEGSVFIGGAVIQWLRDGLGFFKKAHETEAMARSVKDSGGVVLIPAFAGLGAPYWNPEARGMITGLTRGTRREHVIRAALESIAQQSADVLESMKLESGESIRSLKVDGGATANRFLMQFQADLLGIPLLVSDIAESTAWGAAKLAAKMSGFWPSLKAMDRVRRYRRYLPRMKTAKVKQLRSAWRHEIKRLLFSV